MARHSSSYGTSSKGSCIICSNNPGTFSTLDGRVCESCMPEELSGKAPVLKKHNLQIYYNTHDHWKSCVRARVVKSTATVSEDRSMAITHNDPVILADELNDQISTADRIDIVVSFILTSGLNLLLNGLRAHTRNKPLRVITTAYMGVTQFEAIDEMLSLDNTEVRMELEAQVTRLHAKGFIFHRENGSSSAYVGSANISRSALTSGEEWVIKVREEDVPQVIEDLKNGFDSLWHSNHIKPITRSDRADVETALARKGCEL